MTAGGSPTRAAVIGSPVSHSLSPVMFRAAFRNDDLNWTYDAIEVAESDLDRFLDSARAELFGAFSVTMPLKTAIVTRITHMDEASRVLRAVNSVVVAPDGFHGFNTDGDGCCDSLERVGGATISESRAVVFGAGGAARAVVLALASRGAEVAVVNRTSVRAVDAVEMIASARSDCRVRVGTIVDVERADIVVNATPSGMTGYDATSLLSETRSLRAGAVVLDAVYQPLETPFLRDAQRLGARVVDGLWMLAHQAVHQYERWFDRTVPVGVLREAAEQELAGRRK